MQYKGKKVNYINVYWRSIDLWNEQFAIGYYIACISRIGNRT